MILYLSPKQNKPDRSLDLYLNYQHEIEGVKHNMIK